MQDVTYFCCVNKDVFCCFVFFNARFCSGQIKKAWITWWPQSGYDSVILCISFVLSALGLSLLPKIISLFFLSPLYRNFIYSWSEATTRKLIFNVIFLFGILLCQFWSLFPWLVRSDLVDPPMVGMRSCFTTRRHSIQI